MFRHTLRNLMVPAALLLCIQSASAENRLALVIGQSAYKSVQPLPNPINDAKAVTQMLTDSGFEVSTVSDLSQNQIREALSEFAGKVASKGGDSIAVVFYAGHGVQIDGENFLIPVDIDPKRESDIPIQAVRLNDVLNTLTSAPSRMHILLLDACRNNPFAEISKSAGGGNMLVKSLATGERELPQKSGYAFAVNKTFTDTSGNITTAASYRVYVANYDLDAGNFAMTLDKPLSSEDQVRVVFSLVGDQGTTDKSPLKTGSYSAKADKFMKVEDVALVSRKGSADNKAGLDRSTLTGNAKVNSVSGDTITGEVDLTSGAISIKGPFTAKILLRK